MSIASGLRFGVGTGPWRGGTVDVDEDCAYNLLGNRRRRELVKQVAGTRSGVEIADVARRVAAIEASADRSPEELYRPVYVSLRQHHVEALVEADVIAFQHEKNRVTPGPLFDDLYWYVRSDAEHRVRGWTLPAAFAAGIVVTVLVSTMLDPSYDVSNAWWPLAVLLVPLVAVLNRRVD